MKLSKNTLIRIFPPELTERWEKVILNDGNYFDD